MAFRVASGIGRNPRLAEISCVEKTLCENDPDRFEMPPTPRAVRRGDILGNARLKAEQRTRNAVGQRSGASDLGES